MAKKPVEKSVMEHRDGRYRTVKKHSYVVVLTKKGGSEVKAVRASYYVSKEELTDDIMGNFPDWRIKSILKLHEEDFDS